MTSTSEVATCETALVCCPFCLAPLAGLACSQCAASFATTSDGLHVLLDLARPDPPEVRRGGGKLEKLEHYGSLQAACVDGLEGKLEQERCSDDVRSGPMYERLVQWPVSCAVKMMGADLPENARILHIGPGFADEAAMFAKNGARFTALDISANYLRRTVDATREAGLPYDAFFVGAVECLPFEDDTFDLVLLHKTIQWWIDPERGLREAYRVARRVAIIAEPAEGIARRLGQRFGFANRVSPVTQRKINAVSKEMLERALPANARIRVHRYLGKALDSVSPREWVVKLDRMRPLARLAVFALVCTNIVLGRLGNQACAVVEKR